MTTASRIPELDGLRGIAITLVICFHYTNGEALKRVDGVAFFVQRAAGGGWTGVDLFFVLSGFLIGGILLDARCSSNFFQTFYVRRFFRIIPIYYAWIGLYLTLVALAGSHIQAHSFSQKTLPGGFAVYSHFLFVQNFLPRKIAGLTGLWGAWFDHLWSLAIEEQFYLVAPLLIAWMPVHRLRALLLTIVLTAPVFRILLFLAGTRFDATHLMPSRADALAMGILAAILWRSPTGKDWLRSNVRGLKIAAVLLGMGYGLLCWYAPGSESLPIVSVGFSWIATFYALLVVIVMTDRHGLAARLMRISALREIGRVSYCMYVIHLVVALFLYSVILRRRPEIVTWGGAGIAILAALSTYTLARISWEILEGPLVRVGHRVRYRVSEKKEIVELMTKENLAT